MIVPQYIGLGNENDFSPLNSICKLVTQDKVNGEQTEVTKGEQEFKPQFRMNIWAELRLIF